MNFTVRSTTSVSRDRVKKIALVAVIRSKHSLTFSLSIYGLVNYTFHEICEENSTPLLIKPKRSFQRLGLNPL